MRSATRGFVVRRAFSLLALVVPTLAVLGLIGAPSPAEAVTTGNGYWFVASDGGIFSYGDAGFHGSEGGKPLNKPIVGMAAHPSGEGYWFVASDGGVFSFGAATFFGSKGGEPLNKPIVGMAATPTGNGYWLVASDGGMFTFGDAGFFGSEGGRPLNAPIVGMASTPSGAGYWLAASDGGMFTFGDAGFFGSQGGQPLNAPIVGMAATPTGGGYWLAASDGGMFTFGDAGFFGSEGGKPLNAPIVGMASTPTGKGYRLVASDGGIFTFGDAGFFGSRGGQPLNAPIVGMASTPKRTTPTVTINQASSQDDPTGFPAIHFTAVFSEPIVGFTGADVVTGGTAGGDKWAFVEDMGDGRTFDVTVMGMQTAGTVTATILAGAATDQFGNATAEATSTDNTVAFEPDDPTTTVSDAPGQEDPTDETTIDFQVVFSKPVTGFTASDVILSGTAPGTKTATVTGSGTTYNVAVTGVTGNGTVTARVLVGAVRDAAGNPNTASNMNSIEVDRIAPSVAVAKAASQEDPTNEGAVDFTVTFSEAVTDFDDAGDVTIGGGAGGAKTATITGSGTTYNVAVSGMSSNGSVTLAVPAGAAADAAGNANTASPSPASVEYETTGPTVTVGKADLQDNPTDDEAVDFTVTFSESVGDFDDAADVTVGGTASGTKVATITGSGTTYNVAVSGMTPGTAGTVTVDVPAAVAQDVAGNDNAAAPSAASVAYDDAAPTFDSIISSGGSRDVEATFSEPVVCSTVQAGDFLATVNGSPVAVTGATCDSTTDATVTVTLASAPNGGAPVAVQYVGDASPVTDPVGNEVAAPTTRTTTAVTSLTVTVNQAAGQPDPTNETTIDFAVVFSAPVSNFTSADVTVGGDAGGTKTVNVTGTGATYNVAVSGMTTNGTVTASVAAGKASDSAGNVNASSTSTDNSVDYDGTRPSATITRAATQENPTDGPVINFTVVFSEAVSDFDDNNTDVTITPGTTTGTPSAVITGSGTTYNVAVSGVTGDGTLSVSVPADVAIDTAGNSNTASPTAATVTVDNTDPTVTVDRAAGQPTPTNESSLEFTVTFSEPVSGLTGSDFTLAGAAAATTVTVTQTSASVYTASVTGMANDGTVTLTLPAQRVEDTAGNPNQASTTTGTGTDTVTRETVRPTVTVNKASGQADPTNASPVQFTAVFSEPVTGFTASDVTVTAPGTETVTVTAGSPTEYTISVAGMADGDVIAMVPAGGASDVAGNTNVDSTSTDNSVAYDTTLPTATVTKAATQENPTDENVVDFTVTFSEVVSDFDDDADVVIGGTTAGAEEPDITNSSGDGRTYNVAVSGMTAGTSGTVTLAVGAGVARDAAGNLNADAVESGSEVTYDDIAPQFTGIAAEAGSTTVVAQFDEAVLCGTVAASDFLASVGGVPAAVTAAACTAPSDGSIELTLGSAPGNSDNVVVTLTGEVTDAAGNAAPTTSRNVVATPLSVTVTPHADQENPTDETSIEFTVMFSKPVTGFTASDLNVSAPGTDAVAVAPTTGPATTYTVTVSNVSGEGAVTVAVAAGAAQDAGGTSNQASNTATVTRDTTAPTFTSVDVTAGSADIVVTFSDDIDCATVAAGDFTVTFNGSVPATESSIGGCAGDDDVLTLTLLTPVAANTVVTVDLTGTIQDPIGNTVAPATRADTATVS
ncbi:MAG TPA: Ig-like domain-containing protein [Acidimicrobiales bacterium]|nr:Ig-like domain-containing protein [Acidimicrobiales bacterium]